MQNQVYLYRHCLIFETYSSHHYKLKKMKKTLQLFFFFWSILTFSSFAQENSVTGKVTAEDGSTLAGVTVSIKGTNKGTNTDDKGNFRISVPSNSRLIFSYIGFSS